MVEKLELTPTLQSVCGQTVPPNMTKIHEFISNAQTYFLLFGNSSFFTASFILFLYKQLVPVSFSDDLASLTLSTSTMKQTPVNPEIKRSIQVCNCSNLAQRMEV